MRYIIIPLLIILYGWWTIASLIELFRKKEYPDITDNYATAWVEFTSFISFISIVLLSIKYW